MEKITAPPPKDFEGLIALVRILRSEDGCPWDREQTAEQIKTYLLEEAYEVIEALDSGGRDEVCGELGDLLFHVIFLARVFEETGHFTIQDVVRTITEKMIRRHPHVFGRAKVSGTEDVKRRWHEIKMAEAKAKEPAQRGPFASVPRKLPALMRAYRISERAAKAGLCQTDLDALLQGLDKSLLEFKEALRDSKDKEKAEKLGDLLFALIHIARTLNVHPEVALADTIRVFEDRHQKPSR